MKFTPSTEFPDELNIITALLNCNLHCRMCLQAYKTYKGRQVMSMEDFRLTMENVPQGKAIKVGISPFAEPFTMKGFLDYVRVAKEIRPEAYITVNTNLVLMDEAISRELVECGLDRIVLSLNVDNREDFEWFTGKDDYDLACANIRTLSRVRSEAGWALPQTMIQLIKMPRTEGRFPDFQRGWESYVDRVILRDLDDQAATVNLEKEVFEGVDYAPIQGNLICQSPWLSLTVNWKGDIYPCCSAGFNDWHDTALKLGNIREDKLVDVWKSSAMETVRENQYFNADPNCGRCKHKGLSPADARSFERNLLKSSALQLL